ATNSLNGEWRERLATDFIDAYRAQYGRELNGLPIESLNWKIVAEDGGAQLNLVEENSAGQKADATPTGTRPVYFPTPSSGFVECAVYERDSLSQGAIIAG